MSQLRDALHQAKKAHDSLLADDPPTIVTGGQDKRSSEPRSSTPALAGELRSNNSWELDSKVLRRNRVIQDDYAIEALSAYKILRTRLRQKMDANNWSTLAVTAADEGAGKTLTATNLAMTIALHGAHDVYLLDLDLRKPGIAKCLGLPTDTNGLGEYLSGDVSLPDILWDVGVEHLKIIPGSKRFQHSSELLTSPKMRNLITEVISAPNNPIMILDLPPVLSADDALAIGPMVDTILFVVAEANTKRSDILRSLDLMKSFNIMGVVLNKSRNPHQGY